MASSSSPSQVRNPGTVERLRVPERCTWPTLGITHPKGKVVVQALIWYE